MSNDFSASVEMILWFFLLFMWCFTLIDLRMIFLCLVEFCLLIFYWEFLHLYSMKMKWKWKSLSRVQLFATRGLCSPWNSPGQNTGVGSHSLPQGIFPAQGSNPGLLHWRQILYQLSHQGSPKILEWVAYPFSSGSSLPRSWTGVSCIAGRFFTSWATKEALVVSFLVVSSAGFGIRVVVAS